MRLTRLFTGTVFVAVINLVSIVAGFWAYRLLDGPGQLIVQIPVAMVTGICGVMLFCAGPARRLGLESGPDCILVILLAFPAAALIFTGLHFMVAGYLTSFGNILGLWSVQLAQNALAMSMAAALMRNRRQAVRSM